MDITGRILHSTIELDSVSYLLMELGNANQKGITNTMAPDVLFGLSYMLEDISKALKPILEAPNEVRGSSPEKEGAR